jgi:hypothetical protein
MVYLLAVAFPFLVQWYPNCESRPRRGAVGLLGRGRVVFIRDISALNEIWVKDILYTIYFGRHFAWLKYFTYHTLLLPLLATNYKQHILSPTKVRKVFYSLAELYAKSRYLNLFVWRRV